MCRTLKYVIFSLPMKSKHSALWTISLWRVTISGLPNNATKTEMLFQPYPGTVYSEPIIKACGGQPGSISGGQIAQLVEHLTGDSGAFKKIVHRPESYDSFSAKSCVFLAHGFG
jgi:hypothetical protein